MIKEENFENSIKRLSEIVKFIEQNQCSLEDALKLYEEGVGLARVCHQKLQEAEKKVEILAGISENGPKTKPFSE